MPHRGLRKPSLVLACLLVALMTLAWGCRESAADEPQAPVIAAAGDIAGTGSGDETTARLVGAIDPTAVLTLGDHAYPDGTSDEFAAHYHPTWGAFRAITRPVPGNHEYHVPDAAGYFGYFGELAADPGKGYYAYDVGAWHLIALNSEIDHDAGSEQLAWLEADLAASTASCTLAYWHKPRFSAGRYADLTEFTPFWEALHAARADVVLAGHDHNYQRYAPLDPAGTADPELGITEFVVGTGGRSHYALQPDPRRLAGNGDTYGVLKLTLHPTTLEWEFVPEEGGTFSDSGARACISAPSVTLRPSLAGLARDGEVLTADRGIWTGHPEVGYAYRWRRCHATKTWSCASIPGASDATYRLTPADVGARIRVRVVASNAAGEQIRSSLATDVVAAAPPVNHVRPTLSGAALEGEALTATPGDWTGTPPLAYEYRWRRCQAQSSWTCATIRGAAGQRYTLVPADVGARIRVRVVTANAAGAVVRSSLATDVVAPAALRDS
jgi:hypothetical protein